MGDATGVMDTEAMCGTGGVKGATWGAAEVVGAARQVAEVSEADNGGAA
jgi:hypothetical protein